MNDPLLEPFQIKHLKIRNRIFTSAHEPAYSVEGMPTDRYRLYHEERAKGGVGLTMTAGSAVVAEDSAPVFGNLHAYDDAIVPWIQRLTDGVHEHGAACMIQLTHLGRRSIWSHGNWLPVVAPTSLREPAHRAIPKEAEDWDIERIIRKFADAAERMQSGGMDGIEIESYGHLFDQFYSPTTNFREDEFGGSLENRLRFSTRVLEAMRERVGPEFILGLRMSIDEVVPEGLDYNAGIEILKEFEATGLIDFVNVIRGLVATDAQLSNVIPIHGMPAAPHLDFAGLVKENTSLAVLHASKIDDVATARYAIQEGKVDLVGMTRAHMADPHIVLKVIEEREEQIRPCVGATFCLDGIYDNGEALCVHNAATGREAIMPHKVLPAEKRRKIIVIGAGPAGLEAARVAGERGHVVTVFEAMPKAGGQIALTVRNKRRQDFQGVVDWRLAELDRLGVEIIYGHIAEQEDISALNPDVVIVATGGLPQMPPLEKGTEFAVTSWDVLSGEVIPQGNVLLYDDNGTHSALSTAEIIAQSGADLEIVTPERTLGVEIGGVNHVPYARTFNETETRVTLNQRVMSASKENDRLVVELGSDHSSHRSTREVDYLVVDHGTLPNADLYLELKSLSCNQGEIDHNALLNGQPQPCFEDEQESFALYRIGDAVANRNIHAAIYDALLLMKDI
ncbi:MAG: putative N-methylproline demethylase [Acidimicrobiales bacterium AG-410-I20]|nr:MAG: putative N-methylproline demethylase [Acidimicrobiales bacterium AG-410-I20]